MKISMFTDGSARGNPGPGGYGVILEAGVHRKEFSEGYRLTTNNRMELLAVIKGLQALKHPNQEVMVYSDSKYVVESVEKGWVFQWEKKGFSGKKNPDLWKEFLKEFRKHKVKFEWVKGHHTHVENNLCDKLAVSASFGKDLQADAGYEMYKNSEKGML